MKKALLALTAIVLLSAYNTAAQEVSVSVLYANSSYNKFKNTTGYEIGYQQTITSKSRLALAFSHSFNNIYYTHNFFSTSDGKRRDREVQPKNQRLVFFIDYSFNLLKSEKSKLYLGPRIGLNYLKIQEEVSERIGEESDRSSYQNDYSEKNKIGLGVLLEYERTLFLDNFSVFFAATPEIVRLSPAFSVGANNPSAMGAVNLNLGLRFNLNKN